MLIQKQNNSNQSSLLIGQKGLISSSNLMYLVSLTRKFMVALTFKFVWYLTNNALLKFATVFGQLVLVSAKKECFLLLFFLYGIKI